MEVVKAMSSILCCLCLVTEPQRSGPRRSQFSSIHQASFRISPVPVLQYISVKLLMGYDIYYYLFTSFRITLCKDKSLSFCIPLILSCESVANNLSFPFVILVRMIFLILYDFIRKLLF